MKYDIVYETDEFINIINDLYQHVKYTNIYKDSKGAFRYDAYIFKYPDGELRSNRHCTKRITFPYEMVPTEIVEVDSQKYKLIMENKL